MNNIRVAARSGDAVLLVTRVVWRHAHVLSYFRH